MDEPYAVREPYAVIEVCRRPATFATGGEAAWKQAISDAVRASSVQPQPDRWFHVQIHYRTPTPRTVNDRWDIDNLVKPTLGAMKGIFGLRAWKGTPQPDDDRVVALAATKRTVLDGEKPGARIPVWLA